MESEAEGRGPESKSITLERSFGRVMFTQRSRRRKWPHSRIKRGPIVSPTRKWSRHLEKKEGDQRRKKGDLYDKQSRRRGESEPDPRGRQGGSPEIKPWEPRKEILMGTDRA